MFRIDGLDYSNDPSYSMPCVLPVMSPWDGYHIVYVHSNIPMRSASTGGPVRPDGLKIKTEKPSVPNIATNTTTTTFSPMPIYIPPTTPLDHGGIGPAAETDKILEKALEKIKAGKVTGIVSKLPPGPEPERRKESRFKEDTPAMSSPFRPDTTPRSGSRSEMSETPVSQHWTLRSETPYQQFDYATMTTTPVRPTSGGARRKGGAAASNLTASLASATLRAERSDKIVSKLPPVQKGRFGVQKAEEAVVFSSLYDKTEGLPTKERLEKISHGLNLKKSLQKYRNGDFTDRPLTPPRSSHTRAESPDPCNFSPKSLLFAQEEESPSKRRGSLFGNVEEHSLIVSPSPSAVATGSAVAGTATAVAAAAIVAEDTPSVPAVDGESPWMAIGGGVWTSTPLDADAVSVSDPSVVVEWEAPEDTSFCSFLASSSENISNDPIKSAVGAALPISGLSPAAEVVEGEASADATGDILSGLKTELPTDKPWELVAACAAAAAGKTGSTSADCDRLPSPVDGATAEEEPLEASPELVDNLLQEMVNYEEADEDVAAAAAAAAAALVTDAAGDVPAVVLEDPAELAKLYGLDEPTAAAFLALGSIGYGDATTADTPESAAAAAAAAAAAVQLISTLDMSVFGASFLESEAAVTAAAAAVQAAVDATAVEAVVKVEPEAGPTAIETKTEEEILAESIVAAIPLSEPSKELLATTSAAPAEQPSAPLAVAEVDTAVEGTKSRRGRKRGSPEAAKASALGDPQKRRRVAEAEHATPRKVVTRRAAAKARLADDLAKENVDPSAMMVMSAGAAVGVVEESADAHGPESAMDTTAEAQAGRSAGEPRRLPCLEPECPKTYASRGGLKYHIEQDHPHRLAELCAKEGKRRNGRKAVGVDG
ncbi:hypothetical protein HDU96_002997 [Phlyctochytrium bullatum]|nr:hypothetical protein HDU96_002997 [Phlyctochytrium bullatum]